jgi:hypothetical protein
MINATGIAGADAWTTSVIVDSMASPAAAATIAPGEHRMWIVFGSSGLRWPDSTTAATHSCAADGYTPCRGRAPQDHGGAALGAGTGSH